VVYLRIFGTAKLNYEISSFLFYFVLLGNFIKKGLGTRPLRYFATSVMKRGMKNGDARIQPLRLRFSHAVMSLMLNIVLRLRECLEVQLSIYKANTYIMYFKKQYLLFRKSLYLNSA